MNTLVLPISGYPETESERPKAALFSLFLLGLLWLAAVYPAYVSAYGAPAASKAAENEEAETEPDDEEAEEPFSVMRILHHRGLHNIHYEDWTIHGQATTIVQWKPGFSAGYTNLGGGQNSLLNSRELGNTDSTDFYIGRRAPWRGGEIYYTPEMIAEHAFSNVKGLGGDIENGELQKNGGQNSNWYTSRFFLRQTFNLGGETLHANSGQLQMAGDYNSRRVIVSTGIMSIIDIFDKNTYANDPRGQFFNMAFMANTAYDFAADVHGYSSGMAVEWYHDQWALRMARFMPPQEPNGQPLSYQFFKYFGDQLEVEHRHKLGEQPGAIRVLGYRNQAYMGKFSDAIAAFNANPGQNNAANCNSYNFGSANPHAPDLCWARKSNVKMGIGLNMEQSLLDGVGLFFRGMYSDGKTEDDSFTSADRSMSVGALINGQHWRRSKDAIGLGYGMSWISASHVAFLTMGGVDQFIGDGAIRYHPEEVAELFYKFNVYETIWLTADYQYLSNPGYNADRGPVHIVGGRLHLEF